jgi:hypothetical protein
VAADDRSTYDAHQARLALREDAMGIQVQVCDVCKPLAALEAAEAAQGQPVAPARPAGGR